MKDPQGRPTQRARAVRFVAIVLASVAGSLSCWLWAFLLIAIADHSSATADSGPVGFLARLGRATHSPVPWIMGAGFGVAFAAPAVFCLWQRRLLPALGFVLAVSYMIAALSIRIASHGGGLSELEAAPSVTALFTLGALVVVRCVPLRIWTQAPRMPTT